MKLPPDQLTTKPKVDFVHKNTYAYFDWSWEGCGFGQLSFHKDDETAILKCSNACMSREAVRKILHAFADYVADNVVLEYERGAPKEYKDPWQ